MPRSSGDSRTYHHGDLRNAVLLAARRIGESDGFASVSMRAIAQDVGVTPNAAYRHFASRDELLAEVAAQGFGELSSALDVALRQGGSADPGLVRAGVAYVRFGAHNPAMYRLMFTGQLDRRTPVLSVAAEQAWSRLVDAARSCVPSYAASGGRVASTAHAAWALVHGLVLLEINPPLPAETRSDTSVDQKRLSAARVRQLVRRTHAACRQLVAGLGSR